MGMLVEIHFLFTLNIRFLGWGTEYVSREIPEKENGALSLP